MARSPWFPLYVDDLLNDENVLCMSDEAFGVYMKLLCYAWREGSIPADIVKISIMLKKDYEELKAVWHSLDPCFKPHPKDPDRMVNPRLERERKKADAISKSKADAGRKGANSRWGKAVTGNGRAIVLPMAKNSQSQSQPQVHKNKTPPTPRRGDGEFEKFWNMQLRKIGKKEALKSWKRAVKAVSPEKIIQGYHGFSEHFQSSGKEIQYHPHPATWLNQGRWEDERDSEPEQPSPARRFTEIVKDQELKKHGKG